MSYEEGHFYRDSDGDIWQAERGGDVLLFVAFGDGSPDVTTNDRSPVDHVEDNNGGPLMEVRPTGWEAA